MQTVYSEKSGDMQIKIESKKLNSGKCQVKFYITGISSMELYGYTLVDSERTLTDVMRELKEKLFKMGGYENFYQDNLFSINRNNPIFTDNMVIFKNGSR
jgi:hypothetical protein